LADVIADAFPFVIPGRAAGASPESYPLLLRHGLSAILHDQWLWIPGSSLRSAPE